MLLVLLPLGVGQDLGTELCEACVETGVVDTHLLQLREQVLALGLLLHAGLGHRFTARRLVEQRVDDLLLGGLVDRELAHQSLEAVAPGVGAGRGGDLREQLLDLGVVGLDGGDHVVGTAGGIGGVGHGVTSLVGTAHLPPR